METLYGEALGILTDIKEDYERQIGRDAGWYALIRTIDILETELVAQMESRATIKMEESPLWN